MFRAAVSFFGVFWVPFLGPFLVPDFGTSVCFLVVGGPFLGHFLVPEIGSRLATTSVQCKRASAQARTLQKQYAWAWCAVASASPIVYTCKETSGDSPGSEPGKHHGHPTQRTSKKERVQQKEGRETKPEGRNWQQSQPAMAQQPFQPPCALPVDR